MKLFFITLGSIVAIALIALMVIGSLAPETYIYTGKQVPEKYLKIAKDLNVLQDDEQVKYFYSDGFMDIKEGFYIVTDKHLIVYCEHWEDDGEVIPLNDIISIKPRYDDSFMNDSLIYIETISGLQFSFPLSSEKGLDKKFVEAMKIKVTPKIPGLENTDRK